MSKKRTKKDKIKAENKRVAQVNGDGLYSFSRTESSSGVSQKTHSTGAVSSTKDSIEKLFGYPLSAIYKDLGKTAVVTVVVSSLLAVITYYVRFLN